MLEESCATFLVALLFGKITGMRSLLDSWQTVWQQDELCHLRSADKFDVHRAVHLNIIPIVKPTRYTNVSNLFYFGMTLYMFRTVFPWKRCLAWWQWTEQSDVDTASLNSGETVACTQNGRTFDSYEVSLRFPLSFPNRKVSGWRRTDRPVSLQDQKTVAVVTLSLGVRRPFNRPNMTSTDTFLKTTTAVRVETLE